MTFQRGDKIEVFKASTDDAWEDYMNDFIGCHGFIVDPDTSVNDPDALVEVSLEERHLGSYNCLPLGIVGTDR